MWCAWCAKRRQQRLAIQQKNKTVATPTVPAKPVAQKTTVQQPKPQTSSAIITEQVMSPNVVFDTYAIEINEKKRKDYLRDLNRHVRLYGNKTKEAKKTATVKVTPKKDSE